MFILRRITSNGQEVNTCIGESYNLVRKIENEKAYFVTLKLWLLGLKRDDDDVYGFIVHNEGQQIVALYKESVYFIMVGSGQTFANITLK